MKKTLKNTILLLLGLVIMSFGVALSVISELGTTPISCIPNVLKYSTTISLGTITIIFNFILIVMQAVILRDKFRHTQWLQIVTTVIFGYFIDVSLYILTPLTPRDITGQCIACILGCFISAFGVYLEVKSNSIVLPGDGVSLAIEEVTNMEFSRIKSIFDTSNVVVGGVLSLILYHSFMGIGLGTIFAGIGVGYIAGIYKQIADKMSS